MNQHKNKLIAKHQKKEQLFEFLTLSFVRAKNIFDQSYSKNQAKDDKKLDLLEIFTDPSWSQNLDYDLKKEFANISNCLSNLLTTTSEKEVYDKVDKLLSNEWGVKADISGKMILGLKRAFNEVKV